MGEYDLRQGTCDNLGFEYEDQMIAYLAVAACNQKDLKDFWIANNVDGLGAWDDIIIYTETVKGEKAISFLQLKHIANPNRILQFKEYKDEIKKYAKYFETIMSQISNQKTQSKNIELLKKTEVHPEDMEFILMTNGEFNNNSPNFTISSKFKNMFIITNADGLMYEISAKNTAYKNDINFKRQFTIISEQSGVTNDGLLNSIVTQLEALISHTHFKQHLEVAKYLPIGIKEWFHTKKQTLTVTDVKNMISSGILSAIKHIKTVDSASPTLDEGKWDIFQKLIEPFQLVVLSNKPDLILKNFFDKQNNYYIISCETTDIQFVIDCIKTDINIKTIMLVPNEKLDSIFETDISTLNLLNALPVESLALLNDVEIKIQGREIKFGTLLNQYSETKNIFKVDAIINLLLGKFCIGEVNRFLNYYIPRFIPRIYVDRSIILKMTDSFFIVIVEENSEESELKIRSSLQSKSSELRLEKPIRTNEILQCVERDTVGETLSNVQNKFKTVHVLKYHENNNNFKLEWLQSSANINEVKTFIDIEKCDEIKSIEDNLADFCWYNINKVLIVANPGMGKTYFTKNLANHYSIHSWIVQVTLNEINFNDINNFKLFLESYSKKLNPFDKNIFQLYLRKKSVIALFDGFDEVAPEYNEEAINLINEAIKEELKIVVTSREVTKEYLEENLETLAYTLHPFSNKDKIKFLQHFYFENVKKIDDVAMDLVEIRINEFAKNLIKNCSISNWDEEFTGVPLQCRLLAEGFMEECQNYCEIGDENNIPKSLNLITLYETFIDKKMNIHIVEKGKATSYLLKATNKLKKIYLKNHSIAAVQIIFPQVGKKISQEFLEEIKNAEEKNGIITGLDDNGKPVFIHRTFAEYLAAKWLVKIKEGKTPLEESKREEYLKFMLKPEYNVVKDLFDRIVCKQCELHNAILNADLSKVRDILEKNGSRDDAKCGRNALHLISARSARHERVQTVHMAIKRNEEEKYLEILDCLLEKIDWIDEKDSVMGWTPQEYLNHRNAFGVIDRFCAFEQNQLYTLNKSVLSDWDKEEILGMCATYDYARFAEKVIETHKFHSQELTSMTYYMESLKFQQTLGNKGQLLCVASQYGSVKILDVLLKYIDVNIKNDAFEKVPLHFCCNEGHFPVVKLLLKNGGNPFSLASNGRTPIDEALDNVYPNRELIEYVTRYDVLKIGFGEDINAALDEYGRTALHLAAMGKNTSSLERLISQGANVNVTDKSGCTALHEACIKGYLSVIKTLVDNERNAFSVDQYDNKPIDKAIGNRNKELIEYVTGYDVLKIGFGNDIIAALTEKYGYSAMHYAAINKHLCSLEKLISLGANVNVTNKRSGLDIDAKNCNGHPGLLLEVQDLNRNKEIIDLLLQSGANPNIVDNIQLTRLSFARKWKKYEVFILLWDKNKEDLRSKRNMLHKLVFKEGHDVEVRKWTYVGFPKELSHLVDRMAEAGLYYNGVRDIVICFSCNCWLLGWTPSDDPWVEHAKHGMASNCEFLIQKKGKDFIQQNNNHQFPTGSVLRPKISMMSKGSIEDPIVAYINSLFALSF